MHMLQQHLKSEEKYTCPKIQDTGDYTINFKKVSFNNCPVRGYSDGSMD